MKVNVRSDLLILEEANKNPASFKHPEQSETNNDIGIGTDGLPVNMDLWNASIINENESK